MEVDGQRVYQEDHDEEIEGIQGPAQEASGDGMPVPEREGDDGGDGVEFERLRLFPGGETKSPGKCTPRAVVTINGAF